MRKNFADAAEKKGEKFISLSRSLKQKHSADVRAVEKQHEMWSNNKWL